MSWFHFKRRTYQPQQISTIKKVESEPIRCLAQIILKDLEKSEDWVYDGSKSDIDYGYNNGYTILTVNKYKHILKNYIIKRLPYYIRFAVEPKIEFNNTEETSLIIAFDRMVNLKSQEILDKQKRENEEKVKKIFPECF